MDAPADPVPQEQQAKSAEEARTRRALLHMLEDLQRERDTIRQARQQWLDTVDSFADAVMVHDAQLRVIRCNRAYAERAGLSFAEIIGKPYWECFPRRDGPLPGCLDAACTASAGPREEFCLPDGGVYTSRAFPLGRVQASEPQALHLFEDITQERRLEEAGQARTRRILAQSAALSAISSLSALYAGDVQQLAREITERVSWACSVERVNAWLFNAQETELNCIDHFDAAAKNHSSGMVLRQVQFENEFRALKSGSHVAADDALTDPRTSGYVEGYLKPNRI